MRPDVLLMSRSTWEDLLAWSQEEDLQRWLEARHVLNPPRDGWFDV